MPALEMEISETAQALIHSRQNVSPRRLTEPAPSAAQLGPAEPDIPAPERLVSLGCALQNMLLSAHAMGFGTGRTSGRAMGSARLRTLFALTEGEQPACFVNIGAISKYKPQRPRPGASEFVSSL